MSAADLARELEIIADLLDFPSSAATIRRAAEKLRALPAWVPVSERLPENDSGVMVSFWFDFQTQPQEVGEALYVHGVFCDEFGNEIDDVTHWQPRPAPALPSPPAAKEEAP